MVVIGSTVRSMFYVLHGPKNLILDQWPHLSKCYQYNKNHYWWQPTSEKRQQSK